MTKLISQKIDLRHHSSSNAFNAVLGEDTNLKEQFSTTICAIFSKCDNVEVQKSTCLKTDQHLVEVQKSTCLKTDQHRKWYLPQHPVFHPHKPGKVGRGFKGAALFHGLLLKSALVTGPKLLQKMIHVPLRFRKHALAVSVDIAGILFQVGVVPQINCISVFCGATKIAVFQKAGHVFDTFHLIRPLEYFETDKKGTPIAERLPLVWVLSGSLPSTSRLFSTCLNVNTNIESDLNLADEIQVGTRWSRLVPINKSATVLPSMLKVRRF